MQPLFQRYINYLEAEKNASRYTVRNYTSDLIGNRQRGTAKGFFQFLEMRQIKSLEAVDKRVLRDYLGYLIKEGVAKVSLARKLSAIRSFYRYLLREGIVSFNPIEEASSPKLDRRLPEFLTVEETGKLVSMPDPSNPQGQRDAAILELIYAAGLRVSEVASLDLFQLDTDARQARVWGKGNKERVVVIGRMAVKALEAYLRDGRKLLAGDKPTQAVFLNRNGGRLSARTIQKIFIKYASAAGLDKAVHPHLLRHTFATHMLDGGADLRVVQELLGHANLSTTQIYTHITHSHARRVYMAAHPLAKSDLREENPDDPGKSPRKT